MSFTTPWRQHNYMGEFDNDAAAETGIGTTLGWQVANGMMYYDTTLHVLKVYQNDAWVQTSGGDQDLWKTMTGDTGTVDANSPTDSFDIGGDSAAISTAISGDGVVISARDAVADGSTKGVASFKAADFDDDGSGDISLATNVVRADGTVAFTQPQTGVAPTADLHLATKTYVDQAVQGAEWQDSVLDKDHVDPSTLTPTAGDRYIVASAGSETITGANPGSKTFTLAGDQTSKFAALDTIHVKGGSNDGFYTIVSVTYTTSTDIVVNETIPVMISGGEMHYASGVWSPIGVDNIAEYGTAWEKTQVYEGFACWVDDENTSYNFNGAAWVKMASVFNHNDLANPQGGTSNEYYHLTSADYTTLRGGSSDAGSLHNHDSQYYTETELGSTSGGSEGASLIGTDTKTNLNNATDVETALTFLDGQVLKKYSEGAGNPNGSQAGAKGDTWLDTTNGIFYRNYTGVNTGWVVI